MANENQETKLCKHCQMEIPKKAKICPNCRKKQGGKLKWIVIAVVAVFIIGSISSGGDNNPKVEKTGETSQEANNENKATEEQNNIFKEGDIVETDNFKITFISASQYQSENEFMNPKDGYEYWKFEFKFENISDSDQTVSTMMDWECYADNSKVDQALIGNDSGLDATLSSGRTTQGSIYFEIPKDSEKIELEYDINFWQSDKIIFVGK